ncbi:RNA ligase family protein [Paenibacillus piri]|uniref:DNA polymerase LigD n=1 Tax=Paenibacillus piri TaxID=2547395 RepID=A0A4R5L0M3_9BACL|nr:RNA ligase family protein [Paenibacillus piri]TDG00901.1 DNA polymerase LigD [Paenibacillus piri]
MIHIPIKPMLLHKSDSVPAGGGYIHQLKLDGHRCILSYSKTKGFRLFTRHQNDCTRQYPEITRAELDADEVVLDGELVAIVDGKPCFETLMERFQARKSIDRLTVSKPVSFAAFDILYLNGRDLTKLKLADRLYILKQVITPSIVITICDSFDDGVQLFNATKQLGLEGIVSKSRDSLYHLDTRSSNWIKVKNYLYDVVQIGAIRKAEFGWSLLKDGCYVGYTELVPPAERRAFSNIAQQLVRGEDKNWIYLHPHIKCKVKFQCYTKHNLLRTPSFVEFVI